MFNKDKKSAVTLLELLVVVMILGILSSIAVTVYTGHVERARVAACRDIIRQLELAVNRYEVDTGQLPPSSSGLTYAPDDLLYEGNATQGSFGSGYLQLALMHSLSGDMHRPLSHRWLGPYIEFDEDQMGDRFGNPVSSSTPKGYVQLLDPWGMPFYYLTNDHYDSLGGTELPSGHPFYASETYYNPSSFQIFSTGRNGTTYPVPYRGEETDDVNNWRKYGARYASSGGSGTRNTKTVSGPRSARSNDRNTPGTIISDGADSGSPASGDSYRRRDVRMTFDLAANNAVLFLWPYGWRKEDNKVMNPSSRTDPIWVFNTSPAVSYEQLAQKFKNQPDAEVIYEGPDPQQIVPDAKILEVRSEEVPMEQLKEDSKGKPYHLVFAFDQNGQTCWWGANFYSFDQMEEGRSFITRIVQSRVSVTRDK